MNRKIQYILEELPKMCEGILNGVARIKKITEGLKTFSRSPQCGKEVVPLSKIVENALFFCSSSVPKSIDIKYKSEEQGLRVFGDTQQIEQVLINLIINSSHALEECVNPKITIHAVLEDEFIKMTISDNGTGIPEDLLEKIWDPFFTTKAKGKGTGLGLAICREIIEGHEGKIKYSQTIEGGACFHISIPVYKQGS